MMTARPILSHFGIFAQNIDRVVDYYKSVFGMHETDRGITHERKVAFLSSDASHHHQLVIAEGRGEGQESTVAQISFLLPTLADLRETLNRIIAHGDTPQRVVDHGTSWSIYTLDPEGNTVETYVNTSWYIAQPFAQPLDLSLPDAEIEARTLARCRAQPTFRSVDAWRANMTEALKNNSI